MLLLFLRNAKLHISLQIWWTKGKSHNGGPAGDNLACTDQRCIWHVSWRLIKLEDRHILLVAAFFSKVMRDWSLYTYIHAQKYLQNSYVLWCRQLSFNFFFFYAYSQAICEWSDHLVMHIVTALETCHCFKSQGKNPQIIAGKMYNYLHPCLDMKDRWKKLSTIIFIHIWEQSVEWKRLSQVGTALYLAYNVMYAFLLFGIYYLFFLFFLLINCFSFFNSLPLMH